MFGSYKSQAPKVGKTFKHVLRGLRNADGSHPAVHIEHLGEENKPYWLELLAKMKADAQAAVASSATPAEMAKDMGEERAQNREILLRHSARRIENVFHDDGAAATDADIAAFVRSIPDGDFDVLFRAAQNPNNFRDYPITGDPAAIAEK